MKQNEKSRRMFLRDACCGTLGLVGALALLPTLAAEDKKTNLTPDEALAKLKKGNADFLADKATVSSQDHIRRMEIARSQIPFAVMLAQPGKLTVKRMIVPLRACALEDFLDDDGERVHRVAGVQFGL